MILKRIYGYVNKTEMPSLRVHMTSLRQSSQCHEDAKDIIKTHTTHWLSNVAVEREIIK